jgi:hypothetical protein
MSKSVLDLAAEHRDACALAALGERTLFGSGNYKKKIHSNSLGVLPTQIPEALEEARKRGVVVEFDAKGRALFNNNAQRKAYCKMRGVFDMDGGYGDATNTPCPFAYARQ